MPVIQSLAGLWVEVQELEMSLKKSQGYARKILRQTPEDKVSIRGRERYGSRRLLVGLDASWFFQFELTHFQLDRDRISTRKTAFAIRIIRDPNCFHKVFYVKESE